MEPGSKPCPVTLTDAAPYLGRPRSTLACWVHRGWITTEGEHRTLTLVDHKGPRRSARYWLHELQQAELDTRLSPWSQRTSDLVTA